MSGSPKYSQAELDRQRQEQLEQERRRQAEAEARRRREAEERERQRRLEAYRHQVRQQAELVLSQIRQQQKDLYQEDFTNLERRTQQQLAAIAQAAAVPSLQSLSTELEQLESSLFTAASRKRRDDEEKQRRAELERLHFQLEELTRQFARIPCADGLKFDASGQTRVQQALSAVQEAIATGNPKTVPQPLQIAIATVEQHENLVAQQRAEWQRRQAEAIQQQGELQAALAGLQADPVVVRWQTESLNQLETIATQVATAIATEQFEQVAPLLAPWQQCSQEAIANANAAQLKANQRDYITDSIAQTLEEMGFSIIYRQPEHPNHPASATILGAATNSGKGISVSIPVAGEVFYDVDGYVKSTIAAIGGGTAAVCDEAEQMLTEMHQVLEEKFGVQMGEVQWEGKNPNRSLRKADSLPSGERSRSL